METEGPVGGGRGGGGGGRGGGEGGRGLGRAGGKEKDGSKVSSVLRVYF